MGCIELLLLAFGFWLLAFGFWLLAFGFWLLALSTWHLTEHATAKCQVLIAKCYCNPMPRLILASASPRRAELLRNARIPFEIDPANVDEVARSGENWLEYPQRLAREKAQLVLTRHPNDVVLGADTVVRVDRRVLLEKPSHPFEAMRMLRLLSGRSHQVITAVSLVASGFERTESETTTVFFSEIPDSDYLEYINSGEPMDKAGGYGIQGMASRWVERVEGCYFNVVGLPVARVYRMLREYNSSVER